MTSGLESSQSLDQAFFTALLLAGSVERAEAAVLTGIAALNDDFQPDRLVLETVRASMRAPSFASEQREDMRPNLPREIERVLALPVQPRCCLVLRVLVNLTPAVCSEILNLDVHIIEEFTLAGLRELAIGYGEGFRSTQCAEGGESVHSQSC